MGHRATLLFVLASSGLAGCGASAPRANVVAAELEARSARAEAAREHAQLIELGARLRELEHRLASQTRACEATPDARSVDVARAREQPRTEPLRSEGDFLAESRAVAPAAASPAATVALAASAQPSPGAARRASLEQLLEGLREYGFDAQSRLSLERREALRVLLRRDRQLDLMNPWSDH